MARVVLLFLVFAKFGLSHLFYDNIKSYGCRCLLKDKNNQAISELINSIPRNSSRPIVGMSVFARQPTFASNLKSKINYLRKWLAELSLHHSETTTTAPKSTADPLAQPYDDSSAGNVFMRIAQKIIAKYLPTFRGEWTIFDKFECVCDGDLIELLKSKTFINIQIDHD